MRAAVYAAKGQNKGSDDIDYDSKCRARYHRAGRQPSASPGSASLDEWLAEVSSLTMMRSVM